MHFTRTVISNDNFCCFIFFKNVMNILICQICKRMKKIFQNVLPDLRKPGRCSVQPHLWSPSSTSLYALHQWFPTFFDAFLPLLILELFIPPLWNIHSSPVRVRDFSGRLRLYEALGWNLERMCIVHILHLFDRLRDWALLKGGGPWL